MHLYFLIFLCLYFLYGLVSSGRFWHVLRVCATWWPTTLLQDFCKSSRKSKQSPRQNMCTIKKHGFNVAEMWRKMAFFKSWFPFQNCDIITLVEIIVVNDFSEDFLTFAKNFTFGISIQSWTCLRPHSFIAQAKKPSPEGYLFALSWLTVDQQKKALLISGP